MAQGTDVARIASLNVGHQTWARPVPEQVVAALLDQQPDILVLVEYVEGDGRPELRVVLADAGLQHTATSVQVQRQGRSWWNQVLIASRWPITVTSNATGLDPCNGSAFLAVETGGLAIIGARVPMWVRAADWYGAWDKLVPRFKGDLLIGDLNIDPQRQRRRDQRPLTMLEGAGWNWRCAEGGWSYRGYSGVTSRLDHVFVRGELEVLSARYVVDGIVGVGPVDHAALVVEAGRALPS